MSSVSKGTLINLMIISHVCHEYICILSTRYRPCSMLCSALYMLDLARGGTMHVCTNTLCFLCWSQEATWIGVDSANVVTLYCVIMQSLFSVLI